MRGKCPWRRRRREREGSRGEPEGAGPEGRDGGGLVGMAGEPASERGDSGRLTLLPSVCGHPRTLTDTLLAHCCHPCPSLGPAGAALLLLLFPRLCCRSLPPSAPSPALPLLLLLRLPSAGRRTPLTPAAARRRLSLRLLSSSSSPPSQGDTHAHEDDLTRRGAVLRVRRQLWHGREVTTTSARRRVSGVAPFVEVPRRPPFVVCECEPP